MMAQFWKRGVGGVLKGTIYVYQLLLSPILGNNCRFHPNCSRYAMDAIDSHGPLTGTWMAAKRIARCNPWHPGGYDPVPDDPQNQSSSHETLNLASGGPAGQ